MADEIKLDDPMERRIEQNRAALDMIPVEEHGVAYKTFLMIADRGKSLSRSKFDLPKFLQGNEWDCVNVVEKAVGWGFQPSMVASLVYEINGRVGYMSQLLHALLIKSQILAEPIDYLYEGEGDERTCTVIGIFKSALKKPREYRSPPYGKISPKNSPLWKTDPDQQAAYLGLARWVRRHAPHIFLGCYTYEELVDAPADPHVGPDNAKDVTAAAGAALHKRMAEHAAANGNVVHGFHPEAVDRALGHNHEDVAAVELSAAQGRVLHQEATEAVPEPEKPPRKRGRPPGSPNKVKKSARPVRQQAPSQTILPVNFLEYRRHLEAWLPQYDVEQDIEARWRSERALRNACGVVEAQRTLLQIIKDHRIQLIRKG